MSRGIVSKRYAEAFFGLMSEKNLLDQGEVDLKEISRIYQEVEEFRRFLEHRRIPASDKKEIMRRLFKKKVHRYTLNFLLLLCDRHRESGLQDICHCFFEMALQARNITEAEVRSAVPLSEEDLKAIGQRLTQVTGSEIRLHTAIDPSLLGGVVVKVGDKVIDGSIAQRLRKLKEHLMGLSLDEQGGMAG